MKGIKVFKDVAGLDVQLIEEYNTKFIKNENQKQFLLKILNYCKSCNISFGIIFF